MQQEPLDGGNTAGLVAIATLHAPFVLKVDETSKKLADEGLLMREIAANKTLPTDFRESFPRIYAVRTSPPYAYLMEFFPVSDGYRSLEDRLYPKAPSPPPGDTEALRLVEAAVHHLFLGYDNAVNHRLQPNLRVDYLDRIRDRLEAASRRDPRYGSRPVDVNGLLVPPWAETLERLAAQAAKIQTLAPPFITHVHGDPNPGNLILREKEGSVEVKQIDPKAWGVGDYIFDVTKLTHFLESTGPVEKDTYGKPPVPVVKEDGNTLKIAYTLTPSPWTVAAVNAVKKEPTSSPQSTRTSIGRFATIWAWLLISLACPWAGSTANRTSQVNQTRRQSSMAKV